MSPQESAAHVLGRLAPDLAPRITVEAPAPKTCLQYEGDPLSGKTKLCVSQSDCDDSNRLRCAVAHELEVLLDRLTAGPGRPVPYHSRDVWEREMAEEYRSGRRLTAKRRIDLAAVTRLHSAGVTDAVQGYIQWLTALEAETSADTELKRMKRSLYRQRIDALASVSL